jgi:hypothetical protein
MPSGVIAVMILALGLAQTPTLAHAQVDLFSPDTLHGFADLRLTVANGEKSWVRKGYGKTGASGGGDSLAVRPSLAEADIIWTPSLSWNLGATVTGQYQPDQIKPLGVGEAFISYKPTPTGPTRESFRAGLFWPPISLEHSGPTWAVTDSITPSAINSWIGEEVKVLGAEIAISHRFDNGGDIGATLGVFGHDDTSGTLLSLRGWALDDRKATYGGDFPLPPLSGFMRTKQAQITTPVLEIDHRGGAYARVDWRPIGNVMLNALYYDNRGDPIAVVGKVPAEKQWGWDTRFWNFGASVKLNDRMRLKSQYLQGSTVMGYATPKVWIDVDYRSGYLLLARTYGDRTLSGRIDYFETTDNTWKTVDNNAEHGVAMMAAWRQPLGPHVQWLIVAQQVWSTRADRARLGIAPSQAQTVLSSALRLAF